MFTSGFNRPARLLQAVAVLCFLAGTADAGVLGNRYLFVQPDASAPASPKFGWVKVELTWAGQKAEAIPLSGAAAAGAEDVADYGSYRIVSVPEGSFKALGAQLAGQGIRVRAVDNFNRIDTPGASIDVRRGIDPATSPARLIHAYPPKTNGLYLVQFIGPAKAEWYNALIDVGWSITRYLPANAYVVAGPPELTAGTAQLPFVQFFDFYHPFEKASVRFRDGDPHDCLFEVPSTAGKNDAIDAISRLAAVGSVRVDSYENDTYIHARMRGNDAEAILSNPLVIGFGAEPVMGLSDERRTLSLTSNVNTTGSQPLNPTTYLSWLAGRCSLCTATNMPYSTWRVGIADTGLDGGRFGVHHPDLTPREDWGSIFVSPNDPDPCGDCDNVTHGTMIASIIAGNATLGLTDPLGYYYGMGIAPMAGIFSTKISSLGHGMPNNIFAWAQDAASSSVTIQNHSHNDYGFGETADPSGLYTTESRQYDQATRDADADSSNGRVPMLFTVSSGNTHFGPYGNSTFTLPPATAKNVISMGGVENYRPDQDASACSGTQADDFRNIFFEGRHGTAIPGYIKPDLVAPASMIVSARTQWNPQTNRGYCQENVDGNHMYEMDSGTSFAAPAASGAAILVKRYFGSSFPTDVSPAGAKAVLIAGAHSVRGGLDRTGNNQSTLNVGPAPNTQQGFGRLSLDDVLTGATRPVLVDQTPQRHFTTSGQTRTTRLTVRDALKPVVVALVWTDAPATSETDPTHPVTPLVNDLDLTVFPLTTTCTYMQGNYINQTVNPSRGEESVSAPCAQVATPDTVNNVEYARFFADNFTQFDVRVAGSMIQAPGDPGFSSNNNQDFALVVLNADLVSEGNITAPQLTTTRDPVTPTTVHLSWTVPLNMIVDHYEIKRGSTASSLSTVYPNEHGTTKDDVG
ncbi:MAG TPA: S8 family serine peptidase, partial [Thermoanaerobaculia bacterium]|nr:S8 family serine peptidase [Thermoanaerobaculia bacterium]